MVVLTVSLAMLELELAEADGEVDWHIELLELELLLVSDSPSRLATELRSPITPSTMVFLSITTSHTWLAGVTPEYCQTFQWGHPLQVTRGEVRFFLQSLCTSQSS